MTTGDFMRRSSVVLALLALVTLATVMAAQQGRAALERRLNLANHARRHDRGPPGQLPGAGSRRRASSTTGRVDAGHRAAPGAEGEVPGDRHPRPPAGADDARGHRRRRRRRWTRSTYACCVAPTTCPASVSTRTLEAINASPHKDRFRVLAGIDFRNVGPGWARKAVAAARGRRRRPARSASARSPRASA